MEIVVIIHDLLIELYRSASCIIFFFYYETGVYMIWYSEDTIFVNNIIYVHNDITSIKYIPTHIIFH